MDWLPEDDEGLSSPQAASDIAIDTAAVPMTSRRVIEFMVGGASLTAPCPYGEVKGVKPTHQVPSRSKSLVRGNRPSRYLLECLPGGSPADLSAFAARHQEHPADHDRAAEHDRPGQRLGEEEPAQEHRDH